jgi:hypothetical protein
LNAVVLLEGMQVPYYVPRGPKHHSRAISAIFRAAAKPALLIIMETASINFFEVSYDYGKIFSRCAWLELRMPCIYG